VAAVIWWERRREGERTADYLARVLDELGPPFAPVAVKARALHFDDYFCPPAVDDGANIHRLVHSLDHRMGRHDVDATLRLKVQAVIAAAKDGEFDGTKAEAQEWGRSPEGQRSIRDNKDKQ
jgi:hypothetical protein